MKNLVFIVLLLAAGISKSVAQSMLKVRCADNRAINVWIDGRYFNKRGTSVTVGDLPAGLHMLKIYATSYTRKGKPFEEAIYYGKVRTYNGMITQLFYDPYTGKADAREQDISSYLEYHPSAKDGDRASQTGGNEASRDNQTNNDNQPSASPVASPAPPDATGTLSDSKTEKLKTKVAAKKADTEKMNLLKDALKNETFSTAQVSEVMDWFNFESSKVEFAEWAYSKTVDKEVYGDLQTKLTYKKYQEELDKFIKAQ